MTRPLLTLALGALLALLAGSTAHAQSLAPRATTGVRVSLGSGAAYAPEGVQTHQVLLSYQPTDTVRTRAPGRAMHRTGSALMAIGVNTQLAGALGGFFGLIVPWGGCNDFCGMSGLNIALFTTGMVTGGLGLVAFFIGLGLDIRGRIDRGMSARSPLAVTPTGLAVTF